MAAGVAHLPLRGSRSRCTCQHQVPWNVVLTSARTFTTFFFLLYSTIYMYANYCRVQCHSRKESGLTWNQPQPHYDQFIVFLDSIDQATMTEQYEYEPSLTASERCDISDAEYRSWGGDIWLPKRKYQNGELASLWWPESVQILTARKCNIKHHRQFYSRLVLPPYTVKIRGGRLGRIIKMSLCPAIPRN